MASSVGNAIGGVGGYMKYYEGRKMQKEAQKLIDNFKWQDLENSYKNNQVSTLGADLRVEQNQISEAGMVDALQSGGNRALVGGLGRIQANTNNMNREIGANLDEQQKAIDFAASADDSTIRAMKETRQANELAGYGQMLNTGMNMKYGGIADIMNAWQSQGQTESAVLSQVMGMMSGGAMGGGGSTQQPITAQYGGGLPSAGKTSVGAGQLGGSGQLGGGGSMAMGKMSQTPDYTKMYGGMYNGMNYGMGRNPQDDEFGFGFSY